MSIATEKVKPQTERHTLVRITPARYVGPDLSSVGGGVYEMTWPLSEAAVVELRRNGAVLTRASSVSGNDQWSFDETTGLLRVQLASAPSTSNAVIAFYPLFYSSDLGRSYPQDPESAVSTSNPLRRWRPMLISDPSARQSIDDTLSGVLSIADTEVVLSNVGDDEDGTGRFERFLGKTDSFSNKAVKIWMFLNQERLRVFSGRISRVAITSTALTLSVYDVFTGLKQSATPASGNNYPGGSATPKDVFRPIPLVLGTQSWAIFKTYGPDEFSATASAGHKIGYLKDGPMAICSPFNQAVANNTNRTWILCRSLGTLKTQTFGTITRVDVSITLLAFIKFSSYTNVRVGDTIKWTTSGTPHWGVVIGVGNFTYTGLTYDVVVFTGGTINTGSSMVPLKCLAVVLKGGQSLHDWIPVAQDLDYSITETTSSDGITLLKITFKDNFEADLSTLYNFENALDPNVHSVCFNMENNGNYSHAVVLKKMLELAGLTCNAASFTAAGSALSENVAFQIPYLDEPDYSPWLKYVQDLLASTLGYISLNNSDEVTYDLWTAPAAGDQKTGVVMSSEPEARVEYQDIVTDLQTNNPHVVLFSPPSQTTISNNVARYLHEVSNSLTFRHVMASIDCLRAPQIAALRAERRVSYIYETPTDDIDSVLGQSITVVSPRVLGVAGQDNLRIIAIEKSAERIAVVATDLHGL